MAAVAHLLPMQVRKEAEISDCGTFRWSLLRRWDEGKPTWYVSLGRAWL